MARKSINFFGLRRLRYVRAGPLPGHKKTVFQLDNVGVTATERRSVAIGGIVSGLDVMSDRCGVLEIDSEINRIGEIEVALNS